MSKFSDIKLVIVKKFEDEEFSIRMVYAATAAAVVIVGFFAGRLFLPVDEAAVNERREAVMETDKAYLAAVAEGKLLNHKIDELNSDNERIESTFDDVIEYQKQYDKLKSEHDKISGELASARKQLEETRAEYSKTKTALNKLRSEKLTLSPGIYTVGKQLFEGTYYVTGGGSLLVAGADKQLKLNELLDRLEPYEYELEDGDTLKLSGAAVFVPEED